MKIAASSLAFTSQHSATSSLQRRENLRAWVGTSRPDFEGAGKLAIPSPAPAISSAAYDAQAQDPSAASAGAQSINDAIENANNDPILQLIRSMLEMLTGHNFQVFFDEVLRGRTTQSDPAMELNLQTTPTPQPAQSPGSAGFGIEYDRHEIRTESEQTNFQAEGSILTSDGKEIKFRLKLSMQRRYSEETTLSLRAGDAATKDPLVINFGGSAAQLQSRRFKFDLAGNGQNVAMPMLAGNSGYLALDLNGNGRIDSGKELFGPASGNGFADLARHDSDGNGWIDEGDPVFGKLRIWTPGAQAGEILSTLQDKQVGALFLGKLATLFEIRDGSNQSLGAVRASGIYLSENGSAGTLQQIDLSV
ncbi:MAG: hypothetical protein D4S02_02280 [Rhodocyclaceae bacterium]|nr:MAG: hypothetical protein D4S02_02280 [Rhodocyclaceae bacterium]